MGVVISKRQVVRLLTAKLETFRAEDEAVLKAGLCGAYVTVDDTGRAMPQEWLHHANWFRNFTTFRTGPSKSRLAFLVAAVRRRVALCDQRRRACLYGRAQPASIVIGKFKEHKARIFLPLATGRVIRMRWA